MTLYRIATRADWEKAQTEEWFVPADLAMGGFIHLCTREQVSFVLQRHFAGVPDLLVLAIDSAAIAAQLRWETSEPGLPPFPHCYAPIPCAAITGTKPVTWAPKPDHRD